MVQYYNTDMTTQLNLCDLNANGDDDDFLNDTIFPIGSPYIEKCKLIYFFKLESVSAINIALINCRSLKKNFRNVEKFLVTLSKPLTAIALTETWLTSVNQDTYSLRGYNFISQPRIDKPGGGIGIYEIGRAHV